MLEPVTGGTPLLYLLVGAVAGSLSITVALAGVGRWTHQRYSETLGRRRTQARKLRRLACGVRSEYIEEDLGSAALLDSWPAGEEHPSARQRRTYVLPDVIVQLHCDADDVVEAFFVSTRHKRFAPKLEVPWGGDHKNKEIVKLGRTRYAKVAIETVQCASAWAGARHWGYHEVHYMGNPGFYQSYVLASNDMTQIGWPKEESGWPQMPLEHGSESLDIHSRPSWWLKFRHDAAPNTFGVIGAHAEVARFTSMIGPEADKLRVLPET